MAMEGGVASFPVGTEPRLPGGTLLSEDEGSNEPSCVHVCNEGTCVLHDLQLAAELGKTLLERNKELETGLKQQQTVIDDQSQEIEYLSKQSVALREVNDSRLRVYEQLEVSIQELEVTNQRLQDETARDKKRIRSLTQSVECLELRSAELQALVEELRSVERSQRAAAAAASQQREEDGRRDSETEVPSSSDQLAERVALLEHQLTEARERERQERERRQWAETEVSTAQEECSELRHEMAALRERSVKLHTLAEEVHAMEEHRLSPFLRHCSPRACSASPQMAGESHAAETASVEPSHSVWGEDAVRWSGGADHHPPAADDPGSAPASLISDLDAHYRVLLDHMDKYEWLLTSRPPRPATPDQPSSLSLLEELQLSAAPPPPTSLRAAPLRDSGPASLMLMGTASDGDASSSGFSEGSEGSRAVSRATQTPEMMLTPPPPQPVVSTMTSTMMSAREAATAGVPMTSTPQRRVTGVFQHTPQYKQLFQEIFQVLKKPVVVSPALSSTSAASSPAAASTPISTSSPAASPVATASAEASSPGFPVEAVEEAVAARAVTATEAASVSQMAPPPQEKVSSLVTESAAAEVSLQATFPAETLAETTFPVSPSSEGSECLSRATSSRSRSASATRTFSYAEEYQRRLRASTPAAVDGASEGPLGVVSSGSGDEFPLLVRPSEEVAKLRLLERSYAEALKAGRRCFYRPTLL